MQQVWRRTEFQETSLRAPVTTTGSVMDLHHLPNGPRPGSTQPADRRSVVLTVRSEILPIISYYAVICILPRTHRIIHRTFLTDNRGHCANNSSVVWSLLRNDDTITLRSIIRRTRGVCLASGGTFYERIDDALEERIARARSKSARPFPR